MLMQMLSMYTTTITLVLCLSLDHIIANDKGLVNIQRDHCLSAAPRILSQTEKEILCDQSHLYGESPAECAATVNLPSTRRLVDKQINHVLRLCEKASSVGPALCWNALSNDLKFSSDHDLQDQIHRLCENAQDHLPADCFTQLHQKFGSNSRNKEDQDVILTTCRAFHGNVDFLVQCIKDAPMLIEKTLRFQLCSKGHEQFPKVLECAKNLLHGRVPASIATQVCATSYEQDISPETCCLAADKHLRQWKDHEKVALCSNTSTETPVECVQALQNRLRYKFSQRHLFETHHYIDLCALSQNATRTMQCLDILPINTFSVKEQVSLCGHSTLTASEKDGKEMIENVFPALCAARAKLLRLSRSDLIVTLCENASSMAPSDCFENAPKSLSMSSRVALCRHTTSLAPVDCIRSIKWQYLSEEQRVQLCSRVESNGPAKCINALSNGDFVENFGVKVCLHAINEAPAFCSRDAPSQFTDAEKAELCKDAKDDGPASCANFSVTKLKSNLQKAQLCQGAKSIAPAKCAIAAPHGMKPQEVIALCQHAENEMPAKCAQEPFASIVPTRATAQVCALAKTLTPAHCLVSKMRQRSPMTQHVIDECRATIAQPSSIEIVKFAYDCAVLMPKCPLSLYAVVLDQYGERMPQLNEGLVRLEVRPDQPILSETMEGNMLVPIENGTVIFTNIHFLLAGDFSMHLRSSLFPETVTRIHIFENLKEKQKENLCRSLFGLLQCTSKYKNVDESIHFLEIPSKKILEALVCEEMWDPYGIRREFTNSDVVLYSIPSISYRFMTGIGVPNAKMTLWECLDLPKGANKSEIRKAYHKKSLEWHPDKWGRSSTSMRERVDQIYSLISKAYHELTNMSISTLAEN
jgi:hypothetical protein